MAKYYILSIDGGGIRGMLTCVLLERLEEAQPGFLSKVDLFAGTSIGSFLALGLATGTSPTRARILYEALGGQVLARSWPRWLGTLGYALRPKYSNKALKRVLTQEFGDQRLGDLSKKVLISTFDLDNNPAEPDRVRCWKPKFFNNFQAADLDERLVDIALRSAAAPIYFPSYQGYIDGGVTAMNPSMAALAQALDQETGGQALEDMVLLSLGTGRLPRFLRRTDGNWGWLGWARPMLPLMMEGDVAVAHYQCSRLLGDRYHRLNPVLPEAIAADDAGRIEELKRTGSQADLHRTIEWLERCF